MPDVTHQRRNVTFFFAPTGSEVSEPFRRSEQASMGYDFHITRASEWSESESLPIRLDEWKEYVASDPEFRMDNFAEIKTPQGETIRFDSEGLAVWTAYSERGEDSNRAWFDYSGGRIVVKNADDETLEKMKEIAEFFGAKVLGDDGEEY